MHTCITIDPMENSKARIVSISPVVAPGSQTVAIRSELDAGTSELRPGEMVTVQLPLSANTAAWDVPLPSRAHGSVPCLIRLQVYLLG